MTVVAKLGSSIVAGDDGELREDVLDVVCSQVAELHTGGENVVLVVATSSHREAAFAAAEFLMDYLKVSAPFWKKEERADGADWVEARQSDTAAAGRWEGRRQSDAAEKGE